MKPTIFLTTTQYNTIFRNHNQKHTPNTKHNQINIQFLNFRENKFKIVIYTIGNIIQAREILCIVTTQATAKKMAANAKTFHNKS